MSEPLEREELLAAAAGVVAAARKGRGGILAYEGPAGIGKSTVLAAAADRAPGTTVVRALPSELERTFAYGVARRLLGPLLAAQPAPDLEMLRRSPAAAALRVLEHAGEPGDAEQPVIHGMAWLLADAAARTPVLLVVDDAHWADEASLEWLAYVASRLRDVPAALLVATRPVEPRDRGRLASLLAMREHVAVMPVPALSPQAVRTLIERRLGHEAAAREAARVAVATGGNPFLVSEVVGAWAAGEAIDRLPVTLTLRRAVSRRIAQAGPHATALAEAVALLGGAGVALRDAAALARLPLHVARAAADRLGAADVLTDGTELGFAHPLVREAVYETMAPLERAERHGRAARIAAAAGCEPGVVAAHLLATSPVADPWVVERLRAAAAEALAQGAPGLAVQLLRRAREEPPVDPVRVDVLCELGEAAARAQDPQAEAHLRDAIAACGNDMRAAAVGLVLGRHLLSAGRAADAHAVLTGALARAGEDDQELALYIRCELMGAARAHAAIKLPVSPGAGAAHDHADLRGATPGERALLAALAYEAMGEGRPAPLVRSLAERALAGDLLLDDIGLETSLPYGVTAALWVIDAHASALSHLEAWLERARRRGSPVAYALARAGRASVLMRAGSPAEAEADARDALSIAGDHGLALVVPLALYPLVRVLVDRGRLDEAEAELAAHGFGGAIAAAGLLAPVQHARGRLHLARGRHEQAAADFLAAGASLLAAGASTPAMLPWRSDAALALAGLGDARRAAALAEEERALAERAGTAGALGIALRAVALTGPSGRRLARLRESADRLRRADCRVELARTLTDIGLTLLRAGSREPGREALREALDLADRCGADAVAERAHAELAVAGARPRRRRLSGPEALTAAERRVVALAAEGRSNRAIAAELFLSLKTVETHLSHAYSKLSVRRRGDLFRALYAPA